MSHGRRRLPRLPPCAAPVAADAELLARWVAQRDEAAFELLVRRHTPLVLAAGRRLLADPNDADDTFQATFLVLARKAGSIGRGEVLGAWLHRVACRAALRIRADRLKRAGREEPGSVEVLPAPPAADPAWAELVRALDEEVARLPRRHRAAFVLCCLEGKTGEEAGRLLGCPPGTVSSRLTRARERLRDRLTRRGFAPAVALGAFAASPAFASPALVDSTLAAALAFGAGHPLPAGSPAARPAAVAQGVIRTMTATHLKTAVLLVAAGLLAVGGVLAGTRPGDAPEQPLPPARAAADEKRPAAEKGPPVVRLVKPRPGGQDRRITQTCTAEAGRQVSLYPGVPGVLKQVNGDIGDRVKAGQLLAEIDAPALVLDARQAAVAVEQAQGLLKEAEGRVATAKAELSAAKGMVKQREAEAAGAKANLAIRKKQYELIQRAEGKGSSAAEALAAEVQYREAEAQAEAAVVAIENAKLELAVKESKLAQAEAGVATAKANVEAARVGLERARLALAHTRLTAPFDGVIARRDCVPGDFVRPGERADPTPLFTLMQVDLLRVVVWFPEQHIALAKPGLSAEVTFHAMPNDAAAGKVARVAFAVDPSNGLLRAEIDLPNPKGMVRPGMTGEATVKLGKGPADAVRVPASAVFRHEDEKSKRPEPAVYVYKDGKARRTPVRLGWSDNMEIEVASGLKADDLIVTDASAFAPDFPAEVVVEAEKPKPSK